LTPEAPFRTVRLELAIHLAAASTRAGSSSMIRLAAMSS
jgi:hypothetical protein